MSLLENINKQRNDQLWVYLQYQKIPINKLSEINKNQNHQLSKYLQYQNAPGNKLSRASSMQFKNPILIKIWWVTSSGNISFPNHKITTSIRIKSHNFFNFYWNLLKSIMVNQKLKIKLIFVVNMERNFINFRILFILNTNNLLNTLNLWPVNNIMENNSINLFSLNWNMIYHKKRL